MKRLSLAALAGLLALLLPLGPAAAQVVPEGEVTDLPVLSRETPRGSGDRAATDGPAPVAKNVDGDISDWVGEPTRYGGTAVYSAGEYVYQDHIFDAHGPDDGRDAARFEMTDPIEGVLPEAYRIDALAQADATGELGIPTPDQFSYGESYGDATSHQDRSDLAEVRLAVSGDNLALLARTTTMTEATDTALLLLADTAPGSPSYEVPFGSGISTDVADAALFVANGTVRAADLATGDVSSLDGAAAVASPGGWDNALEASFPVAAVTGADGSLSLAIASGKPNADGTGFSHLTLETADSDPHANLGNVAFRFDEPVRIWLEKKQALSLHAGSIDPFFTSLDAERMRNGASQEFVPGPGYHDRIFISDPATGVPQEKGRDGIFQHYGVYLPQSYDGEPTPLQWWLHWRGGNAHTGASVVPKIFKQYGEDRDTIVVSPSGRGTSTWYVGRGHVDFLEVWADVTRTFAIDRDRVYVTGHSMGGWGSYLLTVLYPDRFAGAAPVAGPVTQGAWTGADFPGCDNMEFDGNTPCYIEANGSRPRDQHTRKLLDNARHVPYAILHGTSDELVPYSGVARQAEQLARLGYRFRFYTYPGYEHYTHPAVDQWAEAASYIQSFTRPENPARVTYKRDMPFELATEQVQSGGATLNFDFDSAYWMSELTPVNQTTGVASFDGRSLAIPEQPYVQAPDTGAPTAPGQTGPYVITGLQWLNDPTKSPAPASNAFNVTLSGASGVRLDLGRMAIDATKSVAGSVTTAAPLDLRLDGDWTTAPTVLVDGQPAAVRFANGVATVSIPTGTHALSITPGSADPVEKATVLSFTDASDDSGQYSDSAYLEARLTDVDGAALGGETVSFSLGSSSASAVTDDNGIASVRVPLTESPGEYDLAVNFAGDEGRLSPAISASKFTITKEDSATSLAVTRRGSKRTLTATVRDADSDAGIDGVTVTFTANGAEIGTATTNENGVASIEAPPGYRGGDITFTSVFDGNSFFGGSSDSKRV